MLISALDHHDVKSLQQTDASKDFRNELLILGRTDRPYSFKAIGHCSKVDLAELFENQGNRHSTYLFSFGLKFTLLVIPQDSQKQDVHKVDDSHAGAAVLGALDYLKFIVIGVSRVVGVRVLVGGLLKALRLIFEN